MLSPKNMGEISYFTPQNEGKVGSHGWGILEIKYNPFSSKISLVETWKPLNKPIFLDGKWMSFFKGGFKHHIQEL